MKEYTVHIDFTVYSVPYSDSIGFLEVFIKNQIFQKKMKRFLKYILRPLLTAHSQRSDSKTVPFSLISVGACAS